MPQIKEYTAENAALHPTETGIDAYAQAARRIGSFYQQAGETERRAAQDKARAAEGIVKGTKAFVGSLDSDVKAIGTAATAAEQYATHAEVSAGQKNFAEAGANLTQAWNNTVKNADPNNPTLQTDFMQGTFEPWADSYISGFKTPGGRDLAQAEVDHLRQHLVEKTSADISTLAGVAVTSNIQKSQSAWTNQAKSDPSSVPWLLESSKRSIDNIIDSNPHLKGLDAIKAKTFTLDQAQKEIVRAGAIGAMEKSANPEAAAKDYAKRYGQYISGPELDQLAKSARYYKTVNDHQANIQTAQQLKAQRTDFNTQLNGVKTSLFGDNGFQVPPGTIQKIKELGTHALIAGGDKQAANDLFQTFNKVRMITDRMNKPEPPAQQSHDAWVGLMQDIRGGQMKDDSKIVEALPKLSRNDYASLEREFQKAQTPEGQHQNAMMHTLTQSVTPRLNNADATYRWQTEVNRRFDQLQKDNKDPYQVFDPKSPEYMGSADALKQFTAPLQQSIAGNGGVGAANFKERFGNLPPAIDAQKTQKSDAEPVKPAETAKQANGLPAVNERKEGQIYRLPRGPTLSWTKNGWVPAASM